MYEQFFRLRHAPFSIAPDPRYLFMSERHREALAHLLYGIDAGGGFVLLTGEIGAGKTTVCRCFLEQVPANCSVAYISNPKLTAIELLRTICEEFHLPALPADSSVKDLVDRLNAYLLAAHAAGRNNVLIIDEAQNLSLGVLEELRLLTNLETSERKLLQIILVGQPGLRDMLARPELEQLAQRVVARYHLDALSIEETGAYISHRLAVAGLQGDTPFPPLLTRSIHRITRGLPRRISLLCDRALQGACALGARQVDRSLLQAAAREVFGAESGARPYRPYAVAAFLAAIAGGVLLAGQWNWREPAAFRHAPDAPDAPVAAVAAMSPPSAPAAAAPADPEPAPAPTPAPAPAPAAVSAAAAAIAALGLEPAAPPAPVIPGLGALPDSAAADKGVQLAKLARLWQVELAEGEPCKAALAAGLHCYQSAGGLVELRRLGRPAIVALKDEAGVERHLLLVSLGSTGAGFQAGEREHVVSQSRLGRLMPGSFLTLWRAPPDFRMQVKPGDRGPDVDWVAAQLSVSSGRAQPEANRQYDEALAAAVRAFQNAQGLAVDGVVGPRTYMALNRAAGVPEPRLAAPQRGIAPGK